MGRHTFVKFVAECAAALTLCTLATVALAGPFGGAVQIDSPTPASYGVFGGSVAMVPDLTGDGKPDILVGAPDETVSAQAQAGRVHLFNGATRALITNFISPNAAASGRFGRGVAGIADLNSDGKGDLVVGSAETTGTATNAGRVYVLSGADGSVIHTLHSPNSIASGGFGGRVLVSPSLDGDGTPDIVVSAPAETVASFASAGRVYVFSGATGALIRPLTAATPSANAQLGFASAIVPDISGDGVPEIVAGSPLGGGFTLFNGATGAIIDTVATATYSAAGLSDINGDGKGDIIIGDALFTSQQGRVIVYSGADRSVIHTLSSPNAVNTGFFGVAVADAGDVDGDSKADILVGASSENAVRLDAGHAYLYSGATGARLQTFSSPNIEESGAFGRTVLGAGDLDSDGSPDIIMCSRGEDYGGFFDPGRVYVYLSTAAPAGSFDDHFAGPSLDAANWVVTSGSVPAPSASKVQLNNAVIQTKLAYTGSDTWFEIQGLQYGALSTWGAIDVYVTGYQRSNGFEFYENGSGGYGDGFFYSLGASQGFSMLDFYATVPTTPVNLIVFVNDGGTYIFKDGYYCGGDSSVTTAYDFKLGISASNASASVDRVIARTGDQWGFRRVANGANGPFALGVTGVTMSINNQDFATGYVTVERIEAAPPGLSANTSLLHHWSIGGMSGKAFTASLTFNYTPEELLAAGVGEASLVVYRSDNGGASWTPQTTSLDTINNTATVNNVTQFSLWALAGSFTSVDDWVHY